MIQTGPQSHPQPPATVAPAAVEEQGRAELGTTARDEASGVEPPACRSGSGDVASASWSLRRSRISGSIDSSRLCRTPAAADLLPDGAVEAGGGILVFLAVDRGRRKGSSFTELRPPWLRS
ncbi:unnamed protein product [Urochloa humidicola]